MNKDQLKQMEEAPGFIAALDQSGGSTPGALKRYGIDESAYSNDQEMFDLVHQMRTRIMTNAAFTGDRVIAAILFEMTMDRDINGEPVSSYLWEKKHIVPFLKIDKGLADESNGVQLMKDNPGLDALLDRAIKAGIFGTKMRSVIKSANESGIAELVRQQFAVANQIIDRDLVPIIEPEVDIGSPDKAACEAILIEQLRAGLAAGTGKVMFKLTLPEQPDLYQELVSHERVVRVVALSGGYSRAEANTRLAANHGVIASFSRALTENLRVDLTDDAFTATLDKTIGEIAAASNT